MPRILLDTIYGTWKRLVSTSSITGKRVHDARLAAVSLIHQCDAILTFNTADFSAIPGITLLDPAQPESSPPGFAI